MLKVRELDRNGVEEWDAIYGSKEAARWTIWHDWHLVGLFADRLPQSASVLSLGCGPGWEIAYIASKRADLRWHAADQSAEALKNLEKGFVSYGSISRSLPVIHSAQVVDLNRMPLPWSDRQFDVVMCSEVIEHLTDPEASIREMARVGKMLAITVPAENATDTMYHLWSIGRADLLGWFPGMEIVDARGEKILTGFWSHP